MAAEWLLNYTDIVTHVHCCQGAGGIPTSELLYYNAITSLPLLLAIITCSGEGGLALIRAHEGVAAHGVLWFGGTVLCCALMGVLLNWAQFLCTTNHR